MSVPNQKTRLDRWLWATRVFKTRSLATEACRSGHVKVDGENAKPSRLVSLGDEFAVRKGTLSLRVKVKGQIAKRVGAKLVPDFLEDLTPPEEYERQRESLAQRLLKRDRGLGRPTKKDRREMERLRTETFVDLPSDDFQ